jgi:hypothetical protein
MFLLPQHEQLQFTIFTPCGESSTLTGALCKWWIVSHDCPNHSVSTLEVHKYVSVGKSNTDIPLKFELACSFPCANPLPALARYTHQRNTDFLFQCSQVVSVFKWNALLGKEATHLKERHFDANNEEDGSADDEDGFAIVDVVNMTESRGKNLVPIDDGSVGDAVLKETVGLVEDLVVHELPTDSPAYLEGGALNWLDKNKKRDGSFTLSFSDNDSECDSNFITLPVGVFPPAGVSQKRTAAIRCIHLFSTFSFRFGRDFLDKDARMCASLPVYPNEGGIIHQPYFPS